MIDHGGRTPKGYRRAAANVPASRRTPHDASGEASRKAMTAHYMLLLSYPAPRETR